MARRGDSGGDAVRWRVRGRSRLSRDEQPAWTRALAEGDDAGFFGPGSAVWAVNGALPTLAAGIRALLLQTLHPGAMAGVAEWSRYNEDPLGRLDGTIRWVATTTFGDRRQAAAASAHVSRLHERVTGTYTDAAGAPRPYAANDQHLLRWVHDAFTEAFLGAHLTWGGRIPGGADAYVREWAQAGRLMGVVDPPENAAELRAELAGYLAEAKVDDRVREALRFLRRPGLPGLTGRLYPMLFAGAVASLPAEVRELLGLRRPWWPAITTTRLLLAGGTLVLGRMSPSERNARSRIARLAAAQRAAAPPPGLTRPDPPAGTGAPAGAAAP
ncbi:oxygenase MpaB family protein [Agromyces sp. LHK192]|uniref:oxygenase MpaB family protein n=1 Tax=Agromyces sp. LHK192 TaxID=2498704 RepID=UPI000FDB21A6|nr:oxygenase MpaB family protein [Agromyces sp. LHK192]